MKYLRSDLFKRLAMPLGVAAIACFVLAFFVPWQGVFIGLFTTFIGSFVTVTYVNDVLERHERERWEKVDSIIRERVSQFAAVTISQVRVAFDVGPEELYLGAREAIDLKAHVRDAVIRLAERTLTPMVMIGSYNMDQDDWKRFVGFMVNVTQAGDYLVSQFGARLQPDHLALILSICDKANDIVRLHMLLPDILGVPDELLPHSTKGSSEYTKRFYTSQAADDIQELLELSVKLLKTL